ncbi:meiotic recombination protein SPO11-like [Acipenser oxyrinchus oxyrinchus]|uniref:DNA topoisomerase (ATP-hydrolyzing) n=1 Tax=Acipenser oxyrinchus oxyrinchus TaxID=40147 RepID=A0AAD8CR77_ACIOX|nr:meiotic recombination protein SPO11-like [Acipenser oxyrinchus oxyrinchus]
MLTAVEKLKASLRQSSSAGGDGAEAVVKNVDVLKAIEEVIRDIVLQLSQGKAPALSFHKRTQWSNIRFDDTVGLQMAPDCTVSTVRSDCCTSVVRFSLILKVLSMIYKLVQSNTYATKRDIYYNDTQLFGSQRTLDLIIIDISCMLKVPRRSLHVLATSKGFIAGDLCYTEEDGTRVNCSSNSTAVLVPSNICGIKNVSSAAQFLLIVEKDATFQRLLDDEFCIKLAPCIIITGKGVPDLNTRLMVRKLWDSLHIPIFALVDADPHGIEIMCIYKYGSMSMSFDARSLTVPAVMWLGLLPSDMERLNVPNEVLIPLTKRDLSKLNSLQKRPYMSCQPLWNKEMEIMVKCNMKAELQSLTALAPDYLTRVYLPNKLQFGGWI